MIDTLRHIMEQAEQLSPDQQQLAAERFQQVLDDLTADLAWEQTLSSPEGIAKAQKLAEEARRDVDAGDVEEGGFAL